VVAVSGVALVVTGIFFLGFSRKRYVIAGKSLSLTDGYFHRTLRYAWETTPSIRLRSQEESKSGGKELEYWLVNLVDGKSQYVLDRRRGHQMESRALAEALAKSINCPVIEKGETGDVTIPREELDLPFGERVRRNPSLLGSELPKPASCNAKDWEANGELWFSWVLAGSAMLSELFTLLLILVLLSLVPIFPASHSLEPDSPPAPLQRSFLDLARQEHDFEYFIGVGSFMGILGFVLLGYKKQIRATRAALMARDYLWGIPVWRAQIPTAKLEEIWVRQSSRGSTIQFISDDLMISGRTSSLDSAAWLASKIRHFYAKVV
jgi:hypothetical protein